MKNRFLILTLALLCFTCISHEVSAQALQAEAKLQQYTIRIGDQTKLFLSVRQPAKAHVSFPKVADTIVDKVQVVTINKPDTTYDQVDKNAITVTQGYTITSFDAGTYHLPSFTISSETGTTQTNSLTLQVETVKVDTTKAIYDIKQPMQVTYTWLDWLRDNWYWVAGPLVLVAGLVALILYMRKRPKPQPVAKPTPVRTAPPHVLALNELKALREKKLWQEGEVKEHYIELSEILRVYLERRYAIKTHEKTTDELFDSLKHISIKNEDRKKLRQILALADLVKFAKEKPLPDENEFTMDLAMEFVVNTQELPGMAANEGGMANV